MKSVTLPAFWEHYRKLGRNVRLKAKKAYMLWTDDPFHPSLRFKCINHDMNIWAVRLSLGYRAIGLLESDTITWFWIGNHDSYDRFFG